MFGSDWTRTVSIRVGTDPDDQLANEDPIPFQQFTIHESVLRGHSPFFDKALNGKWKEAQERVIRLPSHAPGYFEIYVNWIYSARVVMPVSASNATTLGKFLGSYVLGDMLFDGDFRDALLDALAEWIKSHRYYLRACLSYIYENTQEKDLLRVLAIDTLVYNKKNWVTGARKDDDVPAEALWDIVSKLRDNGSLPSNEAPFNNDMCHYHVHQKGVCYKDQNITKVERKLRLMN